MVYAIDLQVTVQMKAVAGSAQGVSQCGDVSSVGARMDVNMVDSRLARMANQVRRRSEQNQRPSFVARNLIEVLNRVAQRLRPQCRKSRARVRREQIVGLGRGFSCKWMRTILLGPAGGKDPRVHAQASQGLHLAPEKHVGLGWKLRDQYPK